MQICVHVGVPNSVRTCKDIVVKSFKCTVNFLSYETNQYGDNTLENCLNNLESRMYFDFIRAIQIFE